MDEELTNVVDLKLVIPIESYQRIMAYTQLVDTEITQFADITLDSETGELRIGEVYLLKQTAGGAHVDMEEEDVSGFMIECIKKGMTQLPQCWIHSHVNMEAYFSQIDIPTYKKTLNNGNWIVALVVNKRQEMKAVFQMFKPFTHTWELPIEIDYQYRMIPAALEREVKRKVKEKTVQIPKKEGKKNYEGITAFGKGTADPNATFFTKEELIGKSKRKIFWLPKKFEEAKEIIDRLGLYKEWNEETLKWKFVNYAKNVEYIDYWEVVQRYVPNEITDEDLN